MELDPSTRAARLNYHFMTSAIAPRPIAWVTTVDPATGVVNAAPFSFFQAVSADPMVVMLAILRHSDGRPKDTVRNIRSTGEFVVNVSPKALAKEMVQTSGEYGPEVSELDEVGLGTAPSRKVKPPRIASSPVHFECRLQQEIPVGRDGATSLILGEVVHVAADDAVLDARGNVDPAKLSLLGRLGGQEYVDTERFFSMRRPTQDDLVRKP